MRWVRVCFGWYVCKQDNVTIPYDMDFSPPIDIFDIFQMCFSCDAYGQIMQPERDGGRTQAHTSGQIRRQAKIIKAIKKRFSLLLNIVAAASVPFALRGRPGRCSTLFFHPPRRYRSECQLFRLSIPFAAHRPANNVADKYFCSRFRIYRVRNFAPPLHSAHALSRIHLSRPHASVPPSAHFLRSPFASRYAKSFQ